jgi:uncharacterized protein YciI
MKTLTPTKMRLVALIGLGPKWQPDQPATMRGWIRAHFEYLTARFGEGAILWGGPYQSNDGGMLIFACAAEQDAHAIMADDPAVRSGVLQYELKVQAVLFDRTHVPD